MTGVNEDEKYEQAARRMMPDSRLLRAWSLTGGVSAETTALELELRDGQTRKIVIRRHGQADLKRNPAIAADEFRLLDILHDAGLLVPKPYYVDQSGEILPTPYLIMEYVEGTSALTGDPGAVVSQLAAQLAAIHELNSIHPNPSFLPDQADVVRAVLKARRAKPDESLAESQIRATLESVWPLPPLNQAVLLHGDFWPGNVLWKDGQVAAVIDWEDAALGDPLCDLANGRLEILWAFGRDAMYQFTQHYRSLTNFGFADLPYWDLYAAFRPISRLPHWQLDEEVERRMRAEHRWFTMQAFEQLSGR